MVSSGLSSSCSARMSRLFSGVRSSCDMFAMNSDLYFDETASWLGLLLDEPLGLLDLLVLALGLDVLLREQARPAVRGPRSTRAAPPAASGSSSACDWDCLSRFSVSVLASIVLSTRPMLSVSESRNAWCVGAERRERRELDHGAHRALEEDRQHDDVERRRLAEAGVDPHVVAGNVGEQDPLLLLRALADQALAEPERGREVLALLVAVAGLELQDGLAVRQPLVDRVEDAVLGGDEASRARRGSCSRRR